MSGCRPSWVPEAHNTTGNFSLGAYDLCDETAPSLYASFAAPQINAGDYAGWRFDAPAGTAIIARRIWLFWIVDSSSLMG